MLHWADYLIFVLFLLGSIGIGLYQAFTGGRQKTNEEFISANHQLKLIPTAISLVASYLSALTIVGSSAEIYSFGIMAWPGYTLSAICGSAVVSFLIVPWLYPLQLVSVYEYFNRRYGNSAIQIYTSVMGISSAILYTATATMTPAIAMETATGFPANAAIPIFGIVCTIYTAMGGIRAVIWTDVFQGIVMLGGILTIMIKAFIGTGGVGEVYHLLAAENRTYLDLSPSPTVRHTPWGFLFGLTVGNVAFTGFQQSSVQRFSALPTLSAARRIPFLWFCGTTAFTSISYLIGIALFAYYAQGNCDPLLSGKVENSNQLLPLFVVETFRGIHGFSGLFMGTLCSATLSTISSTLSGAAANAWRDIIRPRCLSIPEHRAASVSKLLVVMFGLISIGLAFLVKRFKGTVIQITISLTSTVASPMVGLFILGGCRCFRRINWQAALTGAVIGSVMNLWITFGNQFTELDDQSLPSLPVNGCSPAVNVTFSQPTYPPVTGLRHFYSISYVWYMDVGAIITIIAANIVSLLQDLVLGKKSRRCQFYPKDEVFIRFRTPPTKRRKEKVDEDNGVLASLTEENVENKTTTV